MVVLNYMHANSLDSDGHDLTHWHFRNPTQQVHPTLRNLQLDHNPIKCEGVYVIAGLLAVRASFLTERSSAVGFFFISSFCSVFSFVKLLSHSLTHSFTD
jgi:hypothetical protein